MTEATRPNLFERAEKFSLRETPLLSAGSKQTLIARARQLWLHAKVCSHDGERHLHTHENEDHAFFIVAGAATFTTTDEVSIKVGRYEGIMIPRGVRYSFVSDGDAPLVILRIGAGETSELLPSGVVKVSLPSDEQHPGRSYAVSSGEVFTS